MMPTSLVTREMEIKAIKYHFQPTRMGIIKTQTIRSVGRDVEKLESSYIAGENGKRFVATL